MVEETGNTRGTFDAVVSFNRHIKRTFYRLGLEFTQKGAEAFGKFRAGQFVQIDLAGVALPEAENVPAELADAAQREILLRRPFSFSDVTQKSSKTCVEILYCVVGPASLRMTTLKAGDSVSVIGPLGNGFWVPQGKKTALLVVGGMGAGPLEYLAKVLTEDYPDIEVIALAGAKSAEELPFKKQLDEISRQLGFSVPEFSRFGIESLVATDDGSTGFHGMVTDLAADWLGECQTANENIVIYTCGPEAMLGKMAEIAKEKNIDCLVSMERRMACGIGVCQSCAVECRVGDSDPVRSESVEGVNRACEGTSNGASETVYKLCCKDGPVFDSKEVVF